MPTYLLAYVIGEYDFVEKRDSDGVLVRVYTPVGKKEQGNFALDVSNTCFDRWVMKQASQKFYIEFIGCYMLSSFICPSWLEKFVKGFNFSFEFQSNKLTICLHDINFITCSKN